MYCWPLKPFDRPHPIRGYFNDPRISGKSRAFHFGVDICGDNGTPVYAVRAGVVYLEGKQSLAVSAGDLDFGYWHIVPAVGSHQRVAKHELLGHIAAPWLHVHFAEHRAGIYRNPLRAGALSPWVDDTDPQVTKIVLSHAGKALNPKAVSGPVDVIAEAHDRPPVHVPPPWDCGRVTPARIRWRVRRGGQTVRPWHTPVDFTKRMIPHDDFHWIYAPRTRQNRPGKPGLYRFFLAHTWSTTTLPDGGYTIDVEASDLPGNTGSASLAFTIANNV